MKATNRQILDANIAINQLRPIKFNGKVLLKLARLGAVLQEQARVLEQTRQALITKYSKDGKPLEGDSAEVSKFQAEWAELMVETTDLDTKIRIKESDLGLEKLEEPPSVTDMRDIMWLIDEK